MSAEFREEMTAIRQIRTLGCDPHDVRHIVLTHLDFDHAGGMDDFPWATVHMLATERVAAEAQETWLDRQRFRPQQWSTRAQWQTHDPGMGEDWFGFVSVRPIAELGIALVPLIGHTLGHAGVAVAGDGGWLLDAGDAYFFHAEMNLLRPRCTPGLRFYEWMMEKDRVRRLANQQRLLELHGERPQEIEVFCAHDVLEFERLAGVSADIPAMALRSVPEAIRDGSARRGGVVRTIDDGR